MKTAEDFKQQAKEKSINSWHIRDCSMCDYPLLYVFSPDKEEVAFDSGCDCNRGGPNYQMRTWDSIAEHYNMQTHPDVIKEMNIFWGFDIKEPSIQ